MNIELTDKEFRRLLDLVYIGNWILNSTREKDRFEDYDILQEKLFAQCAKNGMNALISRWQGHIFPSPAYENGGIHEAIADYEDAVFFDILAEELARRDLGCLDGEPADLTELNARMGSALRRHIPVRRCNCGDGNVLRGEGIAVLQAALGKL